ncbi:MAG: hypothetical protein P1V51_03965 [Deltaproteobacteria bacterium]|nr:hypothetical protein [Deltaproteobacteria bacterium]
MPEVLPVRPYENRIRERVFKVLQEAGLTVAVKKAIPPGLSDAEVVERLRYQHPAVLLIPYHAQTDAEGNSSNGLELAQRIEEQLPRLERVPILMPVSATAIQGVRGMLGFRTRRGPVSVALQRRVLLIDEAELGDPTLPERIRRHAAMREEPARESA